MKFKFLFFKRSTAKVLSTESTVSAGFVFCQLSRLTDRNQNWQKWLMRLNWQKWLIRLTEMVDPVDRNQNWQKWLIRLTEMIVAVDRNQNWQKWLIRLTEIKTDRNDWFGWQKSKLTEMIGSFGWRVGVFTFYHNPNDRNQVLHGLVFEGETILNDRRVTFAMVRGANVRLCLGMRLTRVFFPRKSLMF